MSIELSGNRRTFLKQAAIFGWLGVLAVTGGPAADEPKKALPAPAPHGRNYQLTEHVLKYYETARAS
jgi:hypothetical protein